MWNRIRFAAKNGSVRNISTFNLAFTAQNGRIVFFYGA